MVLKQYLMRSSDFQREENYSEFLRLLRDGEYLDVTFDEESGGVSAVHRFHKFDKQMGYGGIRRGDYERIAVDVLRKNGFRVVLESEVSSPGIKICDGFLDDVRMEIKAIEGNGTWTISTKLRDAEKQNANTVILVFPHTDLYSITRVNEGLRLFNTNPTLGHTQEVTRVVAIVDGSLRAIWDKKATPIEGWSIWEGLRGQNGANPFTIPPSDAKV